VRGNLAKLPLRRRVIALAAAYVIAVSSVITSFVAAQAAAEASAQPDVVICHSSLADEPARGPQDSNGNLCIKSCVGCITSLAMAIPPTVSADRTPQSAFKRLDPPARVVRIAGAKFNAHRSRGPPPVL
jgi:hypothetical protein